MGAFAVGSHRHRTWDLSSFPAHLVLHVLHTSKMTKMQKRQRRSWCRWCLLQWSDDINITKPCIDASTRRPGRINNSSLLIQDMYRRRSSVLSRMVELHMFCVREMIQMDRWVRSAML